MNARILVDEFYPALADPSMRQRYRVDLYLYGPGAGVEYNIQRKILKQEKNWRMNGELVRNPEEDSERFNLLSPGDMVVFEFNEGIKPDSVRAVFLSAKHDADRGLLERLNVMLNDQSMVAVSNAQLESAVGEAGVSLSHPIHNLLIDAELEDFALGGGEIAGSRANLVSPIRLTVDQLRTLRESADRTGLRGEEIAYDYLLSQVNIGEIREFQWVSRENAVSPYDFSIIDKDNITLLIDVKATTGDFGRPIHLSLNELRQIAHGSERYSLYRISNILGGRARLRVLEDMTEMAEKILQHLGGLPEGVTVDSISVNPARLAFGEAIDLEVSNEPEDE